MENSFVYIWSGEHAAYWRPGGHGYTRYQREAGTFPFCEAVKYTGRSYDGKQIKLIPAAPEYEI